MTITSYGNINYTIKGGKLLEDQSYAGGRRISLASLGNILRMYKSTKYRRTSSRKTIRVMYPSSTTYSTVRVAVDGPDFLSVGCVEFYGDNARILRKAALKSSKNSK